MTLPLGFALACGGDDTVTTSGTDTAGTSETETTQGPGTDTTTASTEPTGGSETTGSSSDSDPSTSDPSDTDPSDTDPSVTDPSDTDPSDTDPTTDPSDTDPTETDSTTDPTTDTDTDTDTDTGGVCEFADGPPVTANLFDSDKPDPSCGVREFTGRLEVPGPGVWQLEGCPCGAQCLVPNPWTLEVNAPNSWGPDVPMCLKVVVETTQGFAPDQCIFKSLAIWTLNDNQQVGELVYLAGGQPPVNDQVKELAATPTEAAVCSCEGCCGDDIVYDLSFKSGDLPLLKLGEGDEGMLGKYLIHNFQSHQSGLCDAPGSFSWVAKPN
ncbi:MAG: hypothetical protein KC636_16800 [Myxococcales bacterium]|nr:hypothetical protein [Myxococcales bacterium]